MSAASQLGLREFRRALAQSWPADGAVELAIHSARLAVGPQFDDETATLSRPR